MNNGSKVRIFGKMDNTMKESSFLFDLKTDRIETNLINEENSKIFNEKTRIKGGDAPQSYYPYTTFIKNPIVRKCIRNDVKSDMPASGERRNTVSSINREMEKRYSVQKRASRASFVTLKEPPKSNKNNNNINDYYYYDDDENFDGESRKSRRSINTNNTNLNINEDKNTELEQIECDCDPYKCVCGAHDLRKKSYVSCNKRATGETSKNYYNNCSADGTPINDGNYQRKESMDLSSRDFKEKRVCPCGDPFNCICHTMELDTKEEKSKSKKKKSKCKSKSNKKKRDKSEELCPCGPDPYNCECQKSINSVNSDKSKKGKKKKSTIPCPCSQDPYKCECQPKSKCGSKKKKKKNVKDEEASKHQYQYSCAAKNPNPVPYYVSVKRSSNAADGTHKRRYSNASSETLVESPVNSYEYAQACPRYMKTACCNAMSQTTTRTTAPLRICQKCQKPKRPKKCPTCGLCVREVEANRKNTAKKRNSKSTTAANTAAAAASAAAQNRRRSSAVNRRNSSNGAQAKYSRPQTATTAGGTNKKCKSKACSRVPRCAGGKYIYPGHENKNKIQKQDKLLKLRGHIPKENRRRTLTLENVEINDTDVDALTVNDSKDDIVKRHFGGYTSSYNAHMHFEVSQSNRLDGTPKFVASSHDIIRKPILEADNLEYWLRPGCNLNIVKSEEHLPLEKNFVKDISNSNTAETTIEDRRRALLRDLQLKDRGNDINRNYFCLCSLGWTCRNPFYDK